MRSYAVWMLDLDAVDVEEIATALADQTDYEHRWLIDPRTGEVAFWTSDTGIDGENPVELDELDLVRIDPLPSHVWYRDMVDFADGISAAAWRARARSGTSRTSSTKDIQSSSLAGTPCVMPGRRSGPSSGWPTKG
jgi:hypothetical protein